jgi:hypothetical protein
MLPPPAHASDSECPECRMWPPVEARRPRCSHLAARRYVVYAPNSRIRTTTCTGKFGHGVMVHLPRTIDTSRESRTRPRPDLMGRIKITKANLESPSSGAGAVEFWSTLSKLGTAHGASLGQGSPPVMCSVVLALVLAMSFGARLFVEKGETESCCCPICSSN